MCGRGQVRTTCQLSGESSAEPSLWALSREEDDGICGGGLRAMTKGRKGRGKSGDQPHNLGGDWERGTSPLGRDQP